MTASAGIVRPLTIAEIFDRAVHVLVRRWKLALVVSLASAVPEIVLVESAPHRTPSSSGGAAFAVINIALEAFASTMLIYAYSDESASLETLWRRARRKYWLALRSFVLSTTTLAGVLIGCAAPALVAAATGFAIGGRTAGFVGAAVLGIPGVAIAAIPALALSLALPTSLLEGVGARRGIALGWRRVVHSGDVRRTWLLGSAVVVTIVLVYAIDSAVGRVASIPGFAWTTDVESLLWSVFSVGYGTAVLTVAAIDFRVRARGEDIEAALRSAPAP